MITAPPLQIISNAFNLHFTNNQPKGHKINRLSTILPLFLYFIAQVSASAAEPPAGFISRANIIFRNTGAVDEKTLRACLPDSLDSGSALSAIDSLQKLKHLGLGYHSARVARHRWRQASSAKGQERLEIWIDKGRPTRLGHLSFTGLSRAEESRLRRWIGPVPGSAASDMAVEKILREVVTFHADRGHPYCAARIHEARLDSNSSLILTIQVDKGRPVSLGKIEFKGVSDTRAEVLEKLSRLEEGLPYSEAQIQAARAHLLRSGLFGSVGEPLILSTVNPHRVNLSLTVKELASNRIEAALGSGGGAGSGALAGFVRLHLGNLFGTARACLIDWERPRRGWSSLQVEYHEPWLLGKNLALGLAYSQQVRDSTFTTSSGRVRLSRDFTKRLVLGLGAGYEKTSPGSETYTGAESSSHWSVGGNLDWTNVLRPLNPRSGLELSLSAETGRRKLDDKNLREVRLRIYSAGYLPLKRLPH
ncbi:POTRA domain-containing protein, partial [Gemmatimonadota bacterium]